MKEEYFGENRKERKNCQELRFEGKLYFTSGIDSCVLKGYLVLKETILKREKLLVSLKEYEQRC